jgi:signal peptidase II
MKNTKLLLLILTISIGIDQISKMVAINLLQGKNTSSYIFDIFRLTFSENNGAFLGLGDNLPENIRFLIFTIAVFMMLTGLLIYIIKNPNISKFSLVAISIIVGGGISNLIDRIYNNGAVVDFMNMGIGSLRTGIFNFADVFIMIGIGMFLLLNSKFGKRLQNFGNQ